MLSVISGYLAQQTYLRVGYHSYIDKKIKRLLWPFIAINFITLLLFYLANFIFTHSSAKVPALSSLSPEQWLGFLIGSKDRLPIYPPSYFLRDLFVVSLCVPILRYIGKNPHYMGVFLLGLIAVVMRQPDLTIDTQLILYRTDLVLYFALGYALANFQLIDKIPTHISKPELKLGAFFLICVYLAYYRVDKSINLTYNKASLGLLFLFFIPALFACFERYRQHALVRGLYALSPYSFTLFLTHDWLAMGLGLSKVKKYWILTQGQKFIDNYSICWRI